jgi:hypothetical protein
MPIQDQTVMPWNSALTEQSPQYLAKSLASYSVWAGRNIRYKPLQDDVKKDKFMLSVYACRHVALLVGAVAL